MGRKPKLTPHQAKEAINAAIAEKPRGKLRAATTYRTAPFPGFRFSQRRCVVVALLSFDTHKKELIIDKNSILISLSESEKVQFGKEDFKLQSLPQRVFSSVWAVEQEVNNGGFLQYFSNLSCAETAAFVAEALDTIGAPRTADICKRAISLAFPNGLPASPEAISAAAADFSAETNDGLDSLDAAFFAYPHNLTDFLFAFVSKHPDEFGPLLEIEGS